MNDENNFNHWDPYQINSLDAYFVSSLIEFSYDIIDSQIEQMNEFPDAEAIIQRIQNNVR